MYSTIVYANRTAKLNVQKDISQFSQSTRILHLNVVFAEAYRRETLKADFFFLNECFLCCLESAGAAFLFLFRSMLELVTH